ncbi:hypothetical protein BHM03_00045667 [Ensete ventricosum]|nr:hypothetical protein BHM03_00045667 [Ensete ventricosum]
MLQRAHQYIAAEALVVGKRDESKRPRVEQHRGHPSRPTKRREDRSDMLPSRPPPIPLNSTRTDIFLQIRERGLLKTPNPMKTCFEMRDKRIYYRFHTEHDHDMEECRDLQSQIEDLNPARALVHGKWQGSPNLLSVRSRCLSLKKGRVGSTKSSLLRKRGPSPRTKRQSDGLGGRDRGTASSMVGSIGEALADLFFDAYTRPRRVPL